MTCRRGTRVQIYGEFLPALNGQRVRLLDLPRLTGQLVNLERRTARGGRDFIIMPLEPMTTWRMRSAVPGQSHRRSPAGPGSAGRHAERRRRHAATEKGRIPRGVFVADKNGTGAVVYAAFDFPGQKPAMSIVDFDVGPIRGGIFADIATRIQVLLASAGLPAQSCSFLLICACTPSRLGYRMEETRIYLVPEDRLLSVAAHVAGGF